MRCFKNRLFTHDFAQETQTDLVALAFHAQNNGHSLAMKDIRHRSICQLSLWLVCPQPGQKQAKSLLCSFAIQRCPVALLLLPGAAHCWSAKSSSQPPQSCWHLVRLRQPSPPTDPLCDLPCGNCAFVPVGRKLQHKRFGHFHPHPNNLGVLRHEHPVLTSSKLFGGWLLVISAKQHTDATRKMAAGDPSRCLEIPRDKDPWRPQGIPEIRFPKIPKHPR